MGRIGDDGSGLAASGAPSWGPPQLPVQASRRPWPAVLFCLQLPLTTWPGTICSEPVPALPTQRCRMQEMLGGQGCAPHMLTAPCQLIGLERLCGCVTLRSLKAEQTPLCPLSVSRWAWGCLLPRGWCTGADRVSSRACGAGFWLSRKALPLVSPSPW